MLITISFGPGFDVKGVVLSVTGAHLRVAVQDWADAAELECRYGQWFLENRDPVDITWPKSTRGATAENFTAETLCVRASLQYSMCMN